MIDFNIQVLKQLIDKLKIKHGFENKDEHVSVIIKPKNAIDVLGGNIIMDTVEKIFLLNVYDFNFSLGSFLYDSFELNKLVNDGCYYWVKNESDKWRVRGIANRFQMYDIGSLTLLMDEKKHGLILQKIIVKFIQPFMFCKNIMKEFPGIDKIKLTYSFKGLKNCKLHYHYPLSPVTWADSCNQNVWNSELNIYKDDDMTNEIKNLLDAFFANFKYDIKHCENYIDYIIKEFKKTMGSK